MKSPQIWLLYFFEILNKSTHNFLKKRSSQFSIYTSAAKCFFVYRLQNVNYKQQKRPIQFVSNSRKR